MWIYLSAKEREEKQGMNQIHLSHISGITWNLELMGNSISSLVAMLYETNTYVKVNINNKRKRKNKRREKRKKKTR